MHPTSWRFALIIGAVFVIVAVAVYFPDLLISRHIDLTSHDVSLESHAAAESLCFSHRRIVLMGDSTMAMTAYAFANMFNCTLAREGSRCDFQSYYGYPAMQQSYSKAVPAGSGPTRHGLSARGCMDCHGCHPRLWHCSVPEVTLEFVGVEFARDVEYPTALGDYTQESIIKGYMARNYSSAPYAIVFNTGLHDLAITSSTETLGISVYVANLDWMTSMLKEVGSTRQTKLLWVSTSSVAPRNQAQAWQAITSNKRIAEFNAAADAVMRQKRIGVLDVFPMTQLPAFQALAKDGVHIGAPTQFYYKYVATRIALMLCARKV